MKRILFITLFLLIAGVLVYTQFPFSPSKQEGQEMVVVPANATYKDPTASREERIDDLLSYMTLEEKVGQMALVEKNSIQQLSDVSSYGIGGLLSGMGGKPEENTASAWKAMVAKFMDASQQSRLGIPILYGVDAIHGHSNIPEATIFPHAIGLGATADENLVRAVARATAREMAATGIFWNYAPNLDLPKDIRWGRVFEAFTDDPVLAEKLGRAYVEGLQSEEAFVLATPKHYVGAGSLLFNSSSNPDFLIDQGTTPGNENELSDVYLPPFKAAIDAGAYSVLVGLNAWGKEDATTLSYSRYEAFPKSLRKMLLNLRLFADKKLAANKYLITDVLKGELGFEGFAVSDWYGVYEIPGGDYKAAVTAINAGIDMVMLPFAYEEFVVNVSTAVQKGDISQERIDDAVRRILRAKFAAGLFDEREEVPLEVIGSDAHRALARQAVAASAVLLKNDEELLPLSKRNRHIRIAGSAADNVGVQSGGWTVEWQGIDGNWLPKSTSLLEGISQQVSEATFLEYNKDGIFSTSTPKAPIGIAIVGEKPYAEGWGDRALPILSDEDLNAIDRLRESSEKVVVVLVSGRPLLITGELENWDALVAAWLPGSEGGGVADVLFGDVPFTGTLPLAWPAYAEQLPLSTTDATANDTDVLFPRGYGLQ